MAKKLTSTMLDVIDTCKLRHLINRSCRGCIYEGDFQCEKTKDTIKAMPYEYISVVKEPVKRKTKKKTKKKGGSKNEKRNS